jgi:ligand-binding sensor domain-containing protein
MSVIFRNYRRVIVALGLLLASRPSAFALDPSLDVSQYAHAAWTTHDGFFKGAILAIAQTPDGYLWLGTEFGPLRFDGVRAVGWQSPAGEQPPSSNIRSLLVARDGTLWIGTSQGPVSWKDGKLIRYRELDGENISALLEDLEGMIWAGTWGGPSGRLCGIQSNRVNCYGQDGSLGAGILSLYEDSGGNLWVGASTGLWRWNAEPPKLYPMPERRRCAI